MREILLSAVYAVVLVATLPALAHAEAAAGAPALDAWVLLRAGGNEVQMSGSVADIRHARRHQQKKSEPLLYVRRAGKAWVIRDGGLLGKIDGLWAPVEALDRRMDTLGDEMDALGRQMDALGRQMERADSDSERDGLGGQMDAQGKKMDALGKKMDALGKDLDRASAKAEGALSLLVDEAIRTGKATSVKPPL